MSESIFIMNPEGKPYGVKQLDSTKGSAGENIPVVAIGDSTGNAASVQYPIPTDGDSVYFKDVDWSRSSAGTFTGDLETMFTDYNLSINDATATNPKTFTLRFNRPISTQQIGFGANVGKTFSNVKIIAKDTSGATRGTIDDSADSTPYTSNFYFFKDATGQLTTVFLIEVVVEFYTANEVDINGMLIGKVLGVDALIRGVDDATGLPTYARFDNGEFIVGGQIRLKNGDNTTIGDANPLPVKTYGSVNSTDAQIRLDESTEALLTHDYEHHEIHEGNHFTIRGWSDIAAATTDFMIVTPNTTKWSHVVWSFATEAEFEFYLYEAPTTTADGTLLTSYNNNRNSATVATLLAYSGPTVTVVGTGPIWSGKLGAGKLAGGESRNESEIVLKQNTKYLFRFIKIAAGTLWLDYDFKWYEHTNRN